MNRILNNVYGTLLTILVASMGYLGCSSDKGGNPPYDVDAKLNAAWTSFGSGNFDGAISTFTEVLSHSADNAEALTGRGWCYAFKKDYPTAVNDFNSSIQKTSTADALMGLAAVYRDQPNLQSAIANASAVIAVDSLYVFAKKMSVDFKDAHLIKAQCYFRLGKNLFPLAHVEVNYLCALSGIPLLPVANTLSPADYEMQLAHKLEDLSELLN